jgi:predicted P-loop ATPase
MEVAISTSAIWANALRWNEFSEFVEIALDLPRLDQCEWREVSDRMLLEALAYWQGAKYSRLTKSVMNDALDLVAHRHKHHPVREYFGAIKSQWDGVKRLHKLFQNYYAAVMPPLPTNRPPTAKETLAYENHEIYLAAISICFMVGAVARIMQPGCKQDYTPILVSDDQGRGKSKAIAALCPNPDWFTDNVPLALAEKDTKESLLGVLIVELAELRFSGRDASQRKVFQTTQRDRYRLAYARRTSTHPRQCVFMGTCNDLEFTDPTGNRRYWPVRVGVIDVDKIIADRDQLWAEAVVLYEQGTKWYLDATLEKIAAQKQEAFQEHDILESTIAEWIKKWEGHYGADAPFRLEDLYAEKTGITPKRKFVEIEMDEQRRAGAALRRLKYTKRRARVGGVRGQWWRQNWAAADAQPDRVPDDDPNEGQP